MNRQNSKQANMQVNMDAMRYRIAEIRTCTCIVAQPYRCKSAFLHGIAAVMTYVSIVVMTYVSIVVMTYRNMDATMCGNKHVNQCLRGGLHQYNNSYSLH
jgi:hypothetical protein